MEKAKQKKYTFRTGLTFVLIWLLVASFVMSVSAETKTNGSGSSNGIDWSWKALKSGTTDEGGSGEADVTVNIAESDDTTTYMLIYEISATSHAQTSTTQTCWGSTTTTWNEDASDVTVTATITNNTGSPLMVDSIEISEKLATVNGTAKDEIVPNGETFTIQLDVSSPGDANEEGKQTTNTLTDTVTVTLSTVQKLKVTYYGASNASYTYNDVTLDDTASVAIAEVDPNAPIVLPTEPEVTNGGTFAGWRIGHDGALLAAGATVTISNDTSIYPVIVADGAVKPFTVEGGSDYYFWTDAVKAAGSGGTIVLNQNYTLPTTLAANGVSPAGTPYVYGTDGNVNFIIPSGITLLIPYDLDYTLCTTMPSRISSYTKPTARYTLTMQQGAHILVNGAMSLSAAVNYQGGNGNKSNLGSPTGDVSMVAMESGSSITVNGGAYLYAWGYITGSGDVIAKRNATVYECFQIMDYRGGSASADGEVKDRKIFPISQYYIQNIEAKLILEAGAKEIAFTDVYIRSEQYSTANIFGSADSMFNISNGSVTKRYDGTTDRLIIDINGDASISSVVLKIGGSFSASPIDSESYVLPLNSNITINVNSGTATIDQDMALLPGSEVNIAADAKVKVGNGKSVFVYDVDQWEEFVYAEYYGFSYHKDGNYYGLRLRALTYAPGRAVGVNREAQNMVDAKVCVNGTLDAGDGYIYTTCGPMIYEEGPNPGTEFVNHYSKDNPLNDGIHVDTNVTIGHDGGANIYSEASTGEVILNTSATDVTHQFIQDAWNRGTGNTDDDYFIDIPVTIAKLTNSNGDLVTTTQGTYIYSAEHGRWDAADDSGEAHRIDSRKVTDPTCDSVGYTTYTCSCGYTYRDDFTAPHSNSGCEHKVNDRIDIYGTSVQAGDNLGMYFYVAKEKLPDANSSKTEGTYYAEVIHTKVDGSTETEENIIGELYEDTYYRFYFKGVAAKEMADSIFVMIYNNEDKIVSNTYTESVESYAVDMLKTLDDTSDPNGYLRTALVDMLNYGAACQTYFGYNTANLANARISDYKTYATSEEIECTAVASGDETYFATQSVSTESNLIYTFYFNNLNPDTMKAKITYKDHYNISRGDDVKIGWNDEKKLYYVDVTGLAIADASQMITCEILTSDSTVTTATGSIEAYVKNAIKEGEAVEVCNMLMRFASSAYQYFHNLPISA